MFISVVMHGLSLWSSWVLLVHWRRHYHAAICTVVEEGVLSPYGLPAYCLAIAELQKTDVRDEPSMCSGTEPLILAVCRCFTIAESSSVDEDITRRFIPSVIRARGFFRAIYD